ncbi:uncharacterized protein NPIL_38781 [Nephila pilipes]|uniref:Mos1 transposase HTH domain-containing protein n=1 Tax=Nephila pilipes TaxID=299642 RepID=A0A8X6P9X5_NEPPI|nr:uncharacterized protein NPIL_38781 [Nephila pilipes]
MLYMDASRSEQRVVVRLLVAEGERNADIYRRMVAVYGEHCFVRTIVNKWCKSFREGQQTISDLRRSGQVNIVITDDSIAAVDALMRIINRKVRTRDISDELSLSKGTVYVIVHQHQYSKVGA